MTGMDKKITRGKTFYLIETMLWHGQAGFPYLELHVERLERSARFFDFSFSRATVSGMLRDLSARLFARAEQAEKKFKVRCILEPSGRFEITDVERLERLNTPVTVDVSGQRVDPGDIFLYHKTSNREFFNRERRRLEKEGLFDTLFLNNRGEITQGTITNLFVDSGEGQLLTPALRCGLLPGVLRQKMLKEGRAREEILGLDDISGAKALFVGNSVRGLLRARLRVL